ncbi:hypothetical protein [Radicibacter daui]|uniref:hypothetical protein n=1 Tax=Radicibacter daui TaxID=3064829 RepID=UPI0040470551
MAQQEQEAAPQAGAVLEELREVALGALKELTGWYRSELDQLVQDRTHALAGKLEERQARMALLLSHAERLVRLLRPGDTGARPGVGGPDLRPLIREAEAHIAAFREAPPYEALAAEGAGGERAAGGDA